MQLPPNGTSPECGIQGCDRDTVHRFEEKAKFLRGTIWADFADIEQEAAVDATGIQLVIPTSD